MPPNNYILEILQYILKTSFWAVITYWCYISMVSAVKAKEQDAAGLGVIIFFVSLYFLYRVISGADKKKEN